MKGSGGGSSCGAKHLHKIWEAQSGDIAFLQSSFLVLRWFIIMWEATSFACHKNGKDHLTTYEQAGKHGETLH